MNRPLNVALVTQWLSNSGGGVPAVVAAVARSLSVSESVSISVVGLISNQAEASHFDWGKAQVYALRPSKVGVMGFTIEFDKTLRKISPDVVHLHGLWGYSSIAVDRWRRGGDGRFVVVSPHGMLDPWALRHSWLKKQIAGRLFQKKLLQYSEFTHALTPAEEVDVLNYHEDARTVTIPNGVDLPSLAQTRSNFCMGVNRKLLYLGRLHRKKNIPLLLRAWAALGERTRDWELEIAGWDQNETKRSLQNLIRQLEISENVRLLDPVFGGAKDALFRSADAFVLPSLSEGLPMVVLEAWSYGLPVLMTDACNLNEGFANRAAMRMDLTDAGAKSDLSQFLELSNDALVDMGARGRDLVSRNFTWSTVSEKYLNLYRETVGMIS